MSIFIRWVRILENFIRDPIKIVLTDNAYVKILIIHHHNLFYQAFQVQILTKSHGI